MGPSLDSGKPLRDAYWEVDCAARFFEYYAGVSDKQHGSSIPLGPDWSDWTVKDAIGVSLHIIPWNYPFQLIARGVAPAASLLSSLQPKRLYQPMNLLKSVRRQDYQTVRST